MNEQRIRKIAEESSYHAENSVDYYRGIIDGLTWEAKILKVRDLKFAELLVKECANIDFRHKVGLSSDTDFEIGEVIKQHFGLDK